MFCDTQGRNLRTVTGKKIPQKKRLKSGWYLFSLTFLDFPGGIRGDCFVLLKAFLDPEAMSHCLALEQLKTASSCLQQLQYYDSGTNSDSLLKWKKVDQIRFTGDKSLVCLSLPLEGLCAESELVLWWWMISKGGLEYSKCLLLVTTGAGPWRLRRVSRSMEAEYRFLEAASFRRSLSWVTNWKWKRA